MSEQTPNPSASAASAEAPVKKKSGCAKFALWGFAAFAVLIIIGALVGKKGSSLDTSTESGMDASGAAIVDTNSGIGPARPGGATVSDAKGADDSGVGIGTMRTLIEVAMGDAFDFQKGADVNGQENYTARSSDGTNAIVQILGPAHAPTQASIILLVDPSNKSAISLGGQHMGRFLGVIEGSASDWLQENLTTKDYSSDWEDSKTFGLVRFKLSYVAIGQVPTFTLTASPR